MTMPVDRAAWGTTDPRPAARLLAWISAGLAAAPAVGAALARGPHFTPRSSLLAIAALAGLPHGYLALRLTRHRPTDRFTLDLGAGVVRATRFALVLLALYPVLAILLLLGFGPLFPLLVLEQQPERVGDDPPGVCPARRGAPRRQPRAAPDPTLAPHVAADPRHEPHLNRRRPRCGNGPSGGQCLSA